MNTPTSRTTIATRLLPPFAALALVVLFTGLGFWQLDRAEQKRALQASFNRESATVEITAAAEPSLYRHIRATGRFLDERQFLIDNIVQDGRLGFYVITPFELDGGGPLLLVNRGWVPRRPDGELPAIGIADAPRTIEGRAGRLPRVGIRPGTALQAGGGWPRLATYPTVDELAGALQGPVLPYVLLADPDPESGLVRRWEPRTMGPSRHIAYAFQWFALAIAVVVVTVLVYRKRRPRR
ncbi:MAG TPA: SURF1 family protein [Woeseiaceae bacterium]|nr:SURF1 family protein [Woeseiaceae bacterium]